MKTNINLYHTSCQAKTLHFSLSQLVMLTVASVVFSALAFFATNEFINKYNADKVIAQSELLRLQDEFTALIEAEAKTNAADLHLKLKEQLLQSIAVRQHLLTSLTVLDFEAELNFPDLMLGLSDTNTDKLTISRFSILHNKLNLQGQAKQGELIPQWLSRMQQSPELKTVSFDHIHISKQKNTFFFQVNNINSVTQGVR